MQLNAPERDGSQYTLKMHLALEVLGDVLTGMFVVGCIGSAFVIAISFAEDMHELFTRNE